jgi:hypothetical protein
MKLSDLERADVEGSAKGGRRTRYVVATVLVLGIGVMGVVPAALADGEGCYSNGVAHDCVQPSPVNIGTDSDSTLAGFTTSAPSGTYQDWRLENMGD